MRIFDFRIRIGFADGKKYRTAASNNDGKNAWELRVVHT